MERNYETVEEVQEAVDSLTTLERAAFEAFLDAASDNGFDFAFHDEIPGAAKARGIGKYQLGALLSDLAQKRLIYLDSTGERVNGSGPRLYQHTLRGDAVMLWAHNNS